MEFYIGQIFEEMYPPEAADWCNENDKVIVEIDQVDNVRRFQIQEIPEHIPTYDEQKQARANAYAQEIDPLHAEKIRKTILGTWTEENETEYVEKVTELSASIVERYPYPTE